MLLEKKALVLNKTWSPIHVTTVKNAVLLLFKGTARVVCTKTYQTYNLDDWLQQPPNGAGHIQTVRKKISVPEVLILSNYDKIPAVNPLFSKRNVLKRDKYTCQYCGDQGRDLTIDHIVPKSKGGQTCWDNVVAACEKCNKTKADRTPKGAGMRLRSTPGKPILNVSHVLRRFLPENPAWNPFCKA
jgi:5-methylcytosine-specific restriction endonuclease McrA